MINTENEKRGKRAFAKLLSERFQAIREDLDALEEAYLLVLQNYIDEIDK